MHTESEIRRAIKPLIELYGKLNTSEIKEHIKAVLEFDDDDKKPSETRKNEIKITQRIGNIVAHQQEQIKTYSEGFIVDKTVTPAIFVAITGHGKNIKAISDSEISKRRKKPKKYFARKTDWNIENEKKTNVGALGEEFVLEREKEKVKYYDEQSVERVIHLSILQGDGLGYDICSVNEKGETTYIEVKTTTYSKNTPFYMSRNEHAFFKENIDSNVYVYRVYNFNTNTRFGQIEIINAKDLINDYAFNPITYEVRHK